MTEEEWDNLIERYHMTMGISRREGTMRSYLSTINAYKSWLVANDMSIEFNMESVHEYFKYCINDRQTIGTLMQKENSFKSLALFMYLRGLIPHNFMAEYKPSLHAKFAKIPKYIPPYTVEEYLTILSDLDKTSGPNRIIIKTIIVICWETGLRIRDVLHLRWEYVNWAERLIEVYPSKQIYQRKIARVPMTEGLFKALSEYYKGSDEGYLFPPKMMRYNDYASMVIRRNIRPGIWRGFHAFRRGFITRSADNGAHPLEICSCTGQSLETIRRYFSPDIEKIRKRLENANSTSNHRLYTTKETPLLPPVRGEHNKVEDDPPAGPVQ